MNAPGRSRPLRNVLEAVFRRRAVFLVTALIVVAATVALVLFLPRHYQAEARLLVQHASVNALHTPSAAQAITPADVNSEVDLLRSNAALRRAVDVPAGEAPTRQAQQRMTDLKRRVGIEVVPEPNLIRMTATAGSPEEAERDLQRVLDGYFAVRSGNANAKGTADFFNRQLDEAKIQLDADQEALTNYSLSHEIADLDDEKKLQLGRVSALQDQIAQVDANLALQRNRQAHENQQLIGTPQRMRTTERVITNQYAQERLSTTLVDLQNRRAELVRRYLPADRQIQEIDDKISNTRAAIAEAGTRPASDTASDVNPLWQQLSTSVAITAAEVSGLQAQRGVMQRQFEQAQERLNDLEKSTADVNALKRNLQQAQQDYASLSQRRSDAGLSAQMDRQRLNFDVSLVQAPYASSYPVQPRPLLYSVIAGLLALLLGTLFAMYADRASDHIYTAKQLDLLTGSRTVATLADVEHVPAAEEANALAYRRLLGSIHRQVRERRKHPEQNFLAGGLNTPHGEWPRGAMPDAYCVALTSATPNEGVSYVARHLAEEASRQFGSQVAVVDVQEILRRFETGAPPAFGFRMRPGSSYWVLAPEDDPDAVTRELGEHGSFAARLRPWLQRAREEMDLILLDCPSHLASTLATEMETCVDGYIAVVDSGRARKPAVEQLAVTLSDRRAPVLGYVLNRRRDAMPAWLQRTMA